MKTSNHVLIETAKNIVSVAEQNGFEYYMVVYPKVRIAHVETNISFFVSLFELQRTIPGQLEGIIWSLL